MRQETFSKLKRQVELCYQLPIYKKKFDEVGLKPEDIKEPSDWQKVPFLTRDELGEAFVEDPWGGFFRPDIVRINFTPSPKVGLLPELNTRHDLETHIQSLAKMFRYMGVDKGDIVQVTVSYAIQFVGMAMQQAFEELGAKTIPMGPGNTEQQLSVMQKMGTTVLFSNPSFAMKLASTGEVPKSVRMVIAGGEPFSSIEGYRERLKQAFGGQIIAPDLYGLSEVAVAATECRYEAGPHVDEDFVYLEIIDPDTGRPLSEGERGEIVLSNIDKEAMPMLRFRTGDLSMWTIKKCACGQQSLTLPKGVFGRTDNMVKIKGMKFYPIQLAFVLAGFPNISPREFKIAIRTVEDRDFFELYLKGVADQAEVERIRETIRSNCQVGPDYISVSEELPSGPVIDDRRAFGH